jgi:hypothetical protein
MVAHMHVRDRAVHGPASGHPEIFLFILQVNAAKVRMEQRVNLVNGDFYDPVKINGQKADDIVQFGDGREREHGPVPGCGIVSRAPVLYFIGLHVSPGP